MVRHILGSLTRQIEQHGQEILAFSYFLRARFRTGDDAIEIGVRHGGTSELWARLLPAKRIVGVDRIGHDSYQEPEFSQRARAMEAEFENYRFVAGNSQTLETRLQVETHLSDPRSVGFVFIDGDHSYDGVRRDFMLYSPLVREGGVIAFHDIVDGPRTGGGVHRFWNEIKPTGLNYHEFLVQDPPSDWGGIGVWVKP